MFIRYRQGHIYNIQGKCTKTEGGGIKRRGTHKNRVFTKQYQILPSMSIHNYIDCYNNKNNTLKEWPIPSLFTGLMWYAEQLLKV